MEMPIAKDGIVARADWPYVQSFPSIYYYMLKWGICLRTRYARWEILRSARRRPRGV
jgi:hypothetical protein